MRVGDKTIDIKKTFYSVYQNDRNQKKNHFFLKI